MGFYGNAADFTTYHEDRGRVVPVDWENDIIEAALLLSSDWLDNKYIDAWVGYPTGGFTQSRLWPRSTATTNTFPQYVFAPDEIPGNVVNAVYEAAFRELTTAGSLQKDFTASRYNKVSVDGAISVEYNSAVSQIDVQLQIPIIDSLMKPLLGRGSFSSHSGGSTRI